MTSGNTAHHEAKNRTLNMIKDRAFSCAIGRAAAIGGNLCIVKGGNLKTDAMDGKIVRILQDFKPGKGDDGTFNAALVLFPETPKLTEAQFEAALWQRLQAFHEIDRQTFGWDMSVSSDPASAHFGYSIGGHSFFVVGMHPAASRHTRISPVPSLAFNPHSLFQRLRETGKFERVQAVIRRRDIALQGNINPMLADYGTASEARQYSGRAVENNWICPFRPLAV